MCVIIAGLQPQETIGLDAAGLKVAAKSKAMKKTSRKLEVKMAKK
jgi:hypothetical protein